MARILSLCTYPSSVPRHGGQVRVNAIQQIYRATGYDVRHLAIYRADEYPDEPDSPWNVHFTWPFINELHATGGRTDINGADFLLRDPGARQHVLEMIAGFKPNIIQLEQCWLWPLIKMLETQSTAIRSARIVYSSQNVEYELINSAVVRGRRPVSTCTVALIKQMELDLIAKSDMVVAVSDSDATVFRPTARKVVLAPNGISPRPSATGQDYWKKELNGRRVALFVGSAHPPNAAGFVDLLGPSLGYLSPDDVVVIVGGVCNLLRADPQFRANIGHNLARAMLVGPQDEGGLSTFIQEADVVVVPITEGGGTNIKMAEALYNRKLVICTPKALHGYEAFLDMPFILVRGTPEEFKATLFAALRGEFSNLPALTRVQAERLKTLLWSSTLTPLAIAISELATSQIGSTGRERDGRG